MSDDWEWDPSITTPDGEPVEIEGADETPGHHDPDVLRDRIKRGDTLADMAEEFDVTKSTIKKQVQKADLDVSVNTPVPDWDFSRRIHEQGGIDWFVNQGFEGPDDPNPTEHQCPDCGELYDSEAGQHSCMRRHARKAANHLQELADNGTEVLPV